MTMTTRDKILLALIVILGAIAAYWFFAIKPMRAEISKQSDNIEKKQEELKTAEQQVSMYRTAQVTYESDYSTVVNLGVAIPEDDAIPSLLVQLDSLAGNGVDFTEAVVSEYPASLLAASQVPAATAALGIPDDSGAISSFIDRASTAAAGASAAVPTASAESDSSGSEGKEGESADETVVPGAEAAVSPLPSEPLLVSLQFQGNFFKLYKVISGIDDHVKISTSGQVTVSGRLLSIEGFSIKAGRKGFPDVKFNIGAIAYSLPESESLTEGATPQAPPQGGPQQVSANGETPSPPKSTSGSEQ